MPAIPAIRQSRFLVIGYLRQVPCSLGGNPTASDRAKGYREGRTLLRPDTYAIQIWLEEISHIPASPTQATGNGPRGQSGAPSRSYLCRQICKESSPMGIVALN